MSLALQHKVKHSNRISLQKITEHKQAILWAEYYPQSFGYEISAEILIKTCHLISYYFICHDEQIIGTVFTHYTENIIGIHGLGIIPKFRKQGFAEEVMAYLINKAIDEQVDFATLQSSAIGKNVYLKMGFSEDFLMSNYYLKKKHWNLLRI